MVNKMKVMVLMLMMVMGAMNLMAEEVKAYDQCTGTVKVYTSEMKKQKEVRIKERKLTSLSYIKKICKITGTYKGEDFTAYELDNGKGRFVNFKGGTKVCLVFKNGELYGRYAALADKDIGVTLNLHDKRCYQRTTTERRGSWTYTYYYSDDTLESLAERLKGEMYGWAEVWGITK